MTSADLVIVGAGAAGLMAAIWAGRTAQQFQLSRRIVLLDGANKLGAKILVAGGGRCNVTHDHVSEQAYAGLSRNAIKKVLRRFDVTPTVAFFEELGVKLKREETGKLFPVTDDAHTVLEALLRAAKAAQVTLKHPARVESITHDDDGFCVQGTWGQLQAPRVILATGGKSIPKSGSDGFGYQLAKSLGHKLTDRIFPALVPLRLPADHFITSLSGLTVNATLDLYAGSGKKLVSFTDSTLCTHFGLSGPSVLDFSRYYTSTRFDDSAATAAINWLPDATTEQIESELQSAGKQSSLRWLAGKLPDRLLRALCAESGVDPTMPLQQLTREQRKQLARNLTRMPLPITGDRGYNYAEVTAGGIPLSDIRLETMESRVRAGLYFCGEICDVDGRIGGYNFQWAWSSGYVAGQAAITP